jgi:hypothetical protein
MFKELLPMLATRSIIIGLHRQGSRTGRYSSRHRPPLAGQGRSQGGNPTISSRRHGPKSSIRNWGVPLEISSRTSHHAYEESAPSWRFHSDGDYRGRMLDGDGSGDSVARLAAYAVQSAQWQGRPLRGYGAAYRESLWSKDGYADAYAVVLRHCPNTQARKSNPCAAHFRIGRYALAK